MEHNPVNTKGIDTFRKHLAIQKLTAEMRKHEQADCPVSHKFADGIYARETLVPKGAFAIGKMHRHRTYNILLTGDVSIYAGEGQPVKRLKAPQTFVSGAGVQKVVYAHEDAVFVNVHPTEETDLEKIEAQFIVPESEYMLDMDGNVVGFINHDTEGER